MGVGVTASRIANQRVQFETWPRKKDRVCKTVSISSSLLGSSLDPTSQRRLTRGEQRTPALGSHDGIGVLLHDSDAAIEHQGADLSEAFGADFDCLFGEELA